MDMTESPPSPWVHIELDEAYLGKHEELEEFHRMGTHSHDFLSLVQEVFWRYCSHMSYFSYKQKYDGQKC